MLKCEIWILNRVVPLNHLDHLLDPNIRQPITHIKSLKNFLTLSIQNTAMNTMTMWSKLKLRISLNHMKLNFRNHRMLKKVSRRKRKRFSSKKKTKLSYLVINMKILSKRLNLLSKLFNCRRNLWSRIQLKLLSTPAHRIIYHYLQNLIQIEVFTLNLKMLTKPWKLVAYSTRHFKPC